jgi:hypothetical protein
VRRRGDGFVVAIRDRRVPDDRARDESILMVASA